MSIKVVDLQNQEVKEEQPALEPVEEEEAKEEVDTAVVNEVIEETNEPPKAEEPKEEIKVEVKGRNKNTKKTLNLTLKGVRGIITKTFKETETKETEFVIVLAVRPIPMLIRKDTKE